MIAGSGANQDKDESSRDESPSASIEDAQEVHAEVNAKEDGYSVGVPGPLTRIFVIANRGVANLVQDLILVSLHTYTQFNVVTYVHWRSFNVGGTTNGC